MFTHLKILHVHKPHNLLRVLLESIFEGTPLFIHHPQIKTVLYYNLSDNLILVKMILTDVENVEMLILTEKYPIKFNKIFHNFNTPS